MSLTLAATQSIAGLAGTGTAVTYTLLGDEISGTTDAFKVLAQGQLPTSAAALYTATGVTALVKTILLANTTASLVSVTLYINGTAAANQIASIPIPANGEAFWSDDGWVVLDANGALLQSILPGPNTVTNSMLTDMAAHTYKGNNTGSSGDPIDVTAALLTADLSAATQSAQGVLSASDKIKVDNLWYDATAVGITTSNSGATNVTNFNTWYASAPFGATLYFPPGLYYDFASELTMNRDIRIRLLGAGKGRSILRSTSATANLFNQSVAGFYISFEELGFGASVTRTAGAAVLVNGNNSLLDVRRCEFQGQYRSIDLGSSGGNIGVLNEVVITSPASTAGGSQVRINGSGINMMMQNCTINVTGADVIGIEINQVGAFQASTCDFIGGRNTLLVNATAVVSALYFANCFFDQATFGSTVKFMGTGAISRTKFVQCGITNGGSSGLVACEIAGTGTGTGIPEAIDFLMCDFYNNGFAGTTTGILVTGCRGFDVRLSRIAGFTVGVDVTPYNANGITNFNISGCTIGPTENFAANGTGIRLNAGSFQFGASLIVGNDLSGNTTAALVNNGTYAANAPLIIKDNLGLALPSTPITATPAAITTTTETVLHQVSIPANALLVGTTYKIRAHGSGLAAATGTVLLRLRLGTAGTTADVAVCATATMAVGTAATGWFCDGLVTIRTVGSGGTVLGNMIGITTAISNTAQSATVAVNTTVANFLSLTLTAAGTTPSMLVYDAEFEVVKQ